MSTTTDEIELRLLLEAIYYRYHYDFREYSMASLKRRVGQAVSRFGFNSISELQDRTIHNPELFGKLIGYLTVQVSEMFRDPNYFASIRQKVAPYLCTYPSLKIWVAGCGAGEELYSLAILFREEGLEERTLFYATDINVDGLQKAEAGMYAIDRISQFTQSYLKSGGRREFSDYYTAAYGYAVMDKSLRKRVVFSDHSLVTDSVFAEVQFVSCRNVLIYFNRDLQDRAIGLFKDSLSPNGFLGLGAKESLRFSKSAGAFKDFERTERIFQKAVA